MHAHEGQADTRVRTRVRTRARTMGMYVGEPLLVFRRWRPTRVRSSSVLSRCAVDALF